MTEVSGIYEDFLGRGLTRELPTQNYIGLENLGGVDPNKPVIFIMSHQEHEGEGLGSETRHIVNMTKRLPQAREVRLIVKKAGTRAGRLRHAVSPMHLVILTKEQEPDEKKRRDHNSRIFQRVAEDAKKRSGRLAVAIAPDAGTTPKESGLLIDPSRVKAGGVVKLIKEFGAAGFSHPVIIPVAINHNKSHIKIGPDCYTRFMDAQREEKPQVLADAINSVDSS